MKAGKWAPAITPVFLVALFCAVITTCPLAGADTVRFTKDVIFGNAGGVDLKLDLAEPAGEGPFPAVLCIHGGAWQVGDKSGHEDFLRRLAANGYVAASANYRMLPDYKWPAQIEDVKCAVRWLRANAKKLNVDPGRIGVTGESAGGHLALLVGLTGPGDGLEGSGGNPEQSSRAQAVVNYFGPADFTTWRMWPEGDEGIAKVSGGGCDHILENLLGTSDRGAAVVKQASPAAYASKDDPPVLTFQGMEDPLVPADQAGRLHLALRNAGVVEELVVLTRQGHGWGGKTLRETQKQTIAFFDQHLKPSGTEKAH